jgi:diguanylate cyclase (GGDEF)-like protein
MWKGIALSVTASFGVTSARPGELDAEAFVARADAALYRAKGHGRNCVRVTTEGAVA